MYAIEFETNITGEFIKFEKYKNFINKKVKVIILAEQEDSPKPEDTNYDFSDLQGKLNWQGDAQTEQRKLRDEW